MRIAFLAAALAAGWAAAMLAAALIWLVTVLSGSPDAWSVAPWLIGATFGGFALGTYVAERVAHRATLARRRAVGEPWAFREKA